MAEGLFNQLSPEGLAAISAGTKPATSVNPMVVQVLRGIGLDISNRKPRPVTPEMIETANRIITLGCEAEAFCPAHYLSKVEDWKIDDPKGKSIEEVRRIRDDIRSKVMSLVRDLSLT